jgi:hypothetical protein
MYLRMMKLWRIAAINLRAHCAELIFFGSASQFQYLRPNSKPKKASICSFPMLFMVMYIQHSHFHSVNISAVWTSSGGYSLQVQLFTCHTEEQHILGAMAHVHAATKL